MTSRQSQGVDAEEALGQQFQVFLRQGRAVPPIGTCCDTLEEEASPAAERMPAFGNATVPRAQTSLHAMAPPMHLEAFRARVEAVAHRAQRSRNSQRLGGAPTAG